MMAGREMGMSEAEFWNTDPIFFNEQYEIFQKRKIEEVKAIYGG